MQTPSLIRKARTGALALALPIGLALAPAGAMAGWQTLVVGPGDTVTSLFSRQDIALADLAALTRNADVARQLRALRVGDVVEVRREGDRRLAGLRVFSGKTRLSALPGNGKWRVSTAALGKGERLALTVRKADIALAARETLPAVVDTGATAAPRPDGDVAGAADRVRELEVALLTVLERSMGSRDETPASPVAEARPVVVGLEQRAPVAPAALPAVARAALPLARQVRLAERASHARRLVVAPPVLMPLEPVPAAIIAKARNQNRPIARAPAIAMEVRRAERAMQRRRHQFEMPVPGLDDPRVQKVLAGARGHIGVPYLWGGNSPDSGFDCSGFVVYHLKRVGIRVPRTAHQQFLHTKTTPVPRSRLAPGDLVFFRDAKRPGRIGHVGIYIGKDRFIHAVGDNKPVQITPMSRPHYKKRFVRGGRIIG